MPQAIYTQLYEQDTLARSDCAGGHREDRDRTRRTIADTAALADDFAATGALASDTEDVINLTLAVAGVEVAVIFVEQPGGESSSSVFAAVRASIARACAEIWRKGSHKAAAGASVSGPIEVARSVVLDAVREAMR